MIRFTKYFAALSGLFLLITGCGPRYTPFTQSFYDSYKFQESDLKKIQFYVSEDVVLRKALEGGNVEINEGQVKVVDGRKVEEIVIRQRTPGVLLFMPKEDRFAISFEEDGSEKYLMFGPNEKFNNQYALLASDWSKRRGTVTYGGTRYYTDGSSGFARLMIDLKEIKNIERRRYTAGGRTVN